MPTSGNAVYLQSDANDYVGGGRTYTYTNTNAVIKMASNALGFTIDVDGDQRWSGSFLLPSGAETLQAGYFANLTRTPFADKTVGGVDWGGEGRGCNHESGWLIVDKLTLVDGTVAAIDFRFEQHCEGGTPALHGQVHWVKADADTRPGAAPQAIPANLWQPSASAVPSSGNYLYFESAPGDYVGLGRTYLYTAANAVLTVSADGLQLNAAVTGDEAWQGSFRSMLGLSQLTVGYYAKSYATLNPLVSDLNWSGEGRGCGGITGWFAVDKISYSNGKLDALDLRFEMSCEGSSTAPMRGKLHWIAGDTAGAPGPQNPPPAGLWQPDGSFTAPSGNYVYLVNGRDAKPELATPATTTIEVNTTVTAALSIRVGGFGGWNGNFVAMNSLSQLQPGYYSDLQRYPFNNPAKGGMSWSGYGWGCNKLKGWFLVDKVSYAAGALTSIDLRFEQFCDANQTPMHGILHWAK